MSGMVYRGNGQRQQVVNPEPLFAPPDPSNYIAESGLVNAVNVALLLDRPLLLTGKPGTGKSQLARSLAWELGFGEPLKFNTKSTSVARDLFYTFDTVGRFKSVVATVPLDFLSYNALGQAILYANEEGAVSKYLPPNIKHGGRRRSVVLIDEIDKAPRDFPNDLLNEIDEKLQFSIPELGNALIAADAEHRPVVVITSNSEKDLPDAFLRRCVYYDLPFPKRGPLKEIVSKRLGEFTGGKIVLLDSALELFYFLREDRNQLSRQPATAELLDWLRVLRARSSGSDSLLTEDLARESLSSLAKTAEDQEKVTDLIKAHFHSVRENRANASKVVE